MQERKRYKNILVCYDGFNQVGWKTEYELQKLLEAGTVNYYQKGGEVIYVDKHIGTNIVVGSDNQEISRTEDADSTQTT